VGKRKGLGKRGRGNPGSGVLGEKGVLEGSNSSDLERTKK